MATICNINDPNQRKFGKYLFKKLEKLKSFKAEDLKDLTRRVYDEVLANTDNPSQALLYAAMTPYWAAKLVSFNDSMRKSLKADITMANDVSDNIEADDDFTFLKEYLGIGVEADNIIKEQALQNNLEQSMKAQAKVKRKVATIIKRKLIARPTLWTTQGSEVDKDGNVIESEVFHYTALREVLNSMYNQPTYNTDGKLEATLPVVGPVFLKLVQLKEFAKTQKVKNTLPISDDQMVYAMVDKEGNYLSLNTDLEPVAPADGQTPYFQVMTMQDMLANEVPMKNALSVMLYSTNVPLTYYELEAEQKKEIDLVYEREKTILMNAIKYAKENPGEGYDFDIVGGHFGKVLSDKISSFKFDAKNPFNPQIDDSVSSSDGVVTPQFFTYKNKKYYFEAITSKKGVGGIEEKHVNVILDLIFEEVLGQNGEPLTVSQRREALDKFIYTGIGLKGGVLIDNGKDLFIEITKDGKPLIRTKYNANAEFNGVKGQIDLSMKKLVSIDKLDIDTKRRLMFNLFRSLGYYQISKEGIDNPDTFKWPYIEVNQDARPVLKYSSDVNYINWIQSSDSFAITNPDEQMAVNPFVIVQPTSDTVTDMISSDKNIVKYAEEVSRRYVLDKSQEAERNAEYAKLEAEASRHKAIPQKITGRENIYGRVDPVTKKPLSSFQLISIGLRTKTTRTKDEYINYGTPKPGDIRWMVGYDNERILVRITDVYLTPGSVLSKNNRFGLNEVSRAEWEERNKKEAWLPGSVNDKLSFNIEYEVVRPEDIKPTAKAKAPASAEKGITTKKGFKLSIDKKGKDQGKADLANAFISHPNTNTSSYKYMQDAKQQGIPVNDEIKPGPGVIAFVSVNGNKKATDKQIQDTYSQAKNIIEAGGTVIMDSTKDANSSWNKSGEGSVQEKLGAPYGQTSKGYNYWGPNPEVTTQAPVSAPVTQPTVDTAPVRRKRPATQPGPADTNKGVDIENIINKTKDKGGFKFKLKTLKGKEVTASVEQIEEARKWYNSHPMSQFFKFHVGWNAANMKYKDDAGDAVALWTIDGIILLDGADHSDLYHEAWHGFSQTFLTQEERSKLYSEVASYNGTFVDYKGNTVKFKDATEDQLEEYLAESFREYVLKKGTKMDRETPVKKNIFQRIYEWLKAFFGSSTMDEIVNDPLSNPTVKKYFEDMRLGELNDYSFNAKNRAYDRLAKGTIKPLSRQDKTSESLSYTQSKTVLETVDSIMSKGIEIFNPQSGGRATVLFSKGQNKLAAYRYVYNVFTDPEDGIIAKLNNEMSDLREKYSDASTVEEKQRIQVEINAKQSTIDLANWTVENFGNLENLEENRSMASGVIFQHMMNSEFISEEEKREFFEDIDETKSSREPNQYSGNPQDKALQELAEEDVLNLVRSMYQYDKNKNVVLNEFGVPKLANFATTWNYIAKNVSGILDADKMYDKIVVLAERNPVMRQLLNRLGPFEGRMSSDQAVDPIMNKLQTNFWQAFCKTRVPLVQLTFTEENEGEYNVTVGYATGEVAKVKNNWNKAFGSQYTQFVKEKPYDEEAEKKKVYVSPVQLDIVEVMKAFPTKPTSVEQMLRFLNAVGITVTDNSQVRKEIEMSTDIRRSVSFTYERLRELYENGIAVNFIGDMFRAVTLKNKDVLEDQTHLLNRLANLEARYGDTVTNFMSSNAKGDTQFEHSLNSSLTRFIYEFNESNSQSELVNMAHMNHLDPKRNPFTRGKRSLWQYSLYDPTKNGERRVTADGRTVSLRFENMSGIKGIDKFGEEIGVKTSEADPIGKLLLDFHSAVLRGTPEVMTHSDKSSTYSESLTKVYNPFAGSRKLQDQRYIDDADFMIDESESFVIESPEQVSRGQRMFFKILSNYLYSEMQRMKICRDIVTNQKKDNLEFDYNYAKRGSDFVMFDDILSKDTKAGLRKMLNMVNQDNIENKGLDFYQFLEEYVPELAEKVEKEITNYLGKQTAAVSKRINDANFIDSKITMSVKRNLQQKTKGNDPLKDEVRSFEFTTEDFNEAAIMSYVANSWIHNMETVINVYGDIAQYAVEKDEFHKRNSGFSSTGDIARTDRAAIDFVNQIGNSYSRSVNNEYGKPFADTFIEDDGSMSTAVMEDTEHTATYYKEYYDVFFKYYLDVNKGDTEKAKEDTERSLKNYVNYKEGDGQAWMTFDMYRKTLILFGKWDWNEQEKLFQDIVAGKNVSLDKIAKFFPVKKFQYQGPLKGKGLPVMAMHKFSVVPLIPNVIKDTNLEKLHFRMMEKGIGYAMYKSASKVGTITDNSGNSDKFYTEKGKLDFDRNGKFVRNQIFLHYLKDQLETGEEFKGRIVIPTQMRKLIIEGLVANGVPIDYGKGMSVDERVKSWEALSEKEKLKYPKYAKFKKYEDLLFELTEGKYMELLEKINWTYDGKTKRPNGKIEDLINYVVRNLERQDIAMHELDFIKVHKGKLLVDLSVSFSAEQIEKMLNALVVKELIRQKIKGEPLIQVAKSGWEKPTDEQLRIYGEDLPFYRPGKKKTSAMKIKIALQGDFRKLLNLDDVKELAETAEVKRIANNLNYDPRLVALNMRLKDDNWLDTGDNRRMVTMIGCRIPVQGLNSMEFMEIYEFLPENAGNIIIMPREIVGKTGSDFDIDKMFTMMPNIYSKYGITRYIGYQPKLSTVKRNKLLARENEIAEKVMSIRDKYKDIFERRDKNNEFAYTDEDKMQIKAFKDEYYATRKKLLDDFYAAESLQNSLDNGSIPADRAEEIYLDYHQARTELFTYEEEFADRMALLRSQLNDKKYVELRNRMKKELEPYNRELVDIAVQMESTTTKGIENELMTSMREILEDPENFIGMMRPNSTEIFDDLAEEMAPFASDYNPTDVLNDEPVRLNPKTGKPTISGTRIFEIPFNIYKRNTNSVGKAVLGIGAVENTYNVLYNRIGMYLNPTSGMSVEEYYSKRNRMDEIDGILARQREKIPFEERISKKEIQKLKDERLELKAQVKNFGVQEIYLPHNTMEKDGKTVISLSDIYTKDGKHKIADIISQMINGWVDVAKDAWIFNVQGNKEVAPTLLLMIEAGVPIEHAVYFVSQPLIRKYIERQRQKKSVWAAAIGTAPKAPSMFKYESKKEILDEFGIVKSREFTDKNTGEVVKYLDSRDQFDATRRLTSAFKTSWQDPKALRDRLDGFRNQEQEQFSDFDKAVLLHFLELEDMASASQKFKLTTNVDTSRARSLFEASAKEYAISDLKSEGRIPSEMVDKIAEDTAISSFFNALEYQQEIWSPYFKIRDSKQVKEFIHGILRGPLRNEILENTYGNDANGVRKFVQMFLNDLMAYLFQKKLYDFDMVSMKSFKGFNEESIKSKKVVPLAYLQHGVFFEGDKMYIDRNQLAKDYQNLDKLDKEYPVAPVTRSMFPRENQYFKFVIEREFIRSTKDFQAIEKTGHYQNRLKAISNKQATLPEDKRKLMAYEETIRDIALMNTYNMGFMFNGTSNTSMGDILEGIKARHKSLRRQFEILDSLTLFKHSMLSNIRLIDSPKDSDTISLYNEQIKQLMNPDNLNIDAPQEEKEFIANFFQKMPFYSLLQSGYDTNTSFSLQRIMPWESYVNLMSPVFKELTKEKDAKEFTNEFLEDYFNQFYSQNSVQNMKKRNRVKVYNKSSTVSYKEMLFPEDASLARIGIEGNNSMSVSYDYNGKPLFKMGSVSISGMSKQQAEKTIEEYYENIRSLIKNNPNLVFVYNDVFDDTIGTPLKAAKQNDWVLKRLQAEFPENIIGLPTRRVYSETSSQSMINEDEYDDFIDALFRRIDLMKAMEKQGKTLVFNKMGYGQILIGANDATTKLPEKKPMPKTISPDAFDDVSQALLTNFGFLNPNYQDMEGIKAYQKKIVTVQDILDQINVCFTK